MNFELRQTLASLGSTKAKDRKDAAKLLRNELESDPALRAGLDKNQWRQNAKISLASHPLCDKYTWGDVCLSLLKYLLQEADSYKKASVKEATDTTETRRKGVLKDSSSNMRSMMKHSLSEKGMLYSSIVKIFKQLLKLVNDSKIFDIIGTDLGMILGDLLSVQEYCNSLTKELWESIFKAYAEYWASGMSLDTCCFAKVIDCLMDHAHIDLLEYSKEFSKLCKLFFKSSSKDLSSTQWILKAVVKFSLKTFMECRLSMNSYVLDINPYILQYLNSRNPSVNHSVIQYFRVVFRFYFKRARSIVPFQDFNDLYDTLMNSLDSLSSSDSNMGSLCYTRMCLLDLAADICHSAAVWQSQEKARLKDMPENDQPQKTKRRRVVGFCEKLRERFRSGHRLEQTTISYLQLCTAIVTKYPDSMDTDLYMTLLESFSPLVSHIQESFSASVWLMKFCFALVSVEDSLQGKIFEVDFESKRRFFLEECFSFAAHRTENEQLRPHALLLLSKLIEKDCVHKDIAVKELTSVISLYLRGKLSLSLESLTFLWKLIEYCSSNNLFELMIANVDFSEKPNAISDFKLSLLSWMLGGLEKTPLAISESPSWWCKTNANLLKTRAFKFDFLFAKVLASLSGLEPSFGGSLVGVKKSNLLFCGSEIYENELRNLMEREFCFEKLLSDKYYTLVRSGKGLFETSGEDIIQSEAFSLMDWIAGIAKQETAGSLNLISQAVNVIEDTLASVREKLDFERLKKCRLESSSGAMKCGDASLLQYYIRLLKYMFSFVLMCYSLGYDMSSKAVDILPIIRDCENILQLPYILGKDFTNLQRESQYLIVDSNSCFLLMLSVLEHVMPESQLREAGAVTINVLSLVKQDLLLLLACETKHLDDDGAFANDMSKYDGFEGANEGFDEFDIVQSNVLKKSQDYDDFAQSKQVEVSSLICNSLMNFVTLYLMKWEKMRCQISDVNWSSLVESFTMSLYAGLELEPMINCLLIMEAFVASSKCKSEDGVVRLFEQVLQLLIDSKYKRNEKCLNCVLQILYRLGERGKDMMGNYDVDSQRLDVALKSIFGGFQTLYKKHKLGESTKKLYGRVIALYLTKHFPFEWQPDDTDVADAWASMFHDEWYTVRYDLITNVLGPLAKACSSRVALVGVFKTLDSSWDEYLNEEVGQERAAERRLTSILAYAKWGSISLKDEIYCINVIIEKSTETECTLVRRVLKHIGGKTVRSQLLEGDGNNWFSMYLLNIISYSVTHFLSKNIPIGRYPFKLFGVHSLKQFLSDFASTVFPLLILKRGTVHVNRLCKENEINLADMVSQCFDSIFACALPLYYENQRDVAERVIKQWMSGEVLDERKVSELLTKNLNSVIVSLLSLVNDQDEGNHSEERNWIEPLYPSYSKKTIGNTLKYLAKGVYRADNINALLFNDNRVHHRVLLHLETNFKEGLRTCDQVRHFKCYIACIEYIAEELARASVLRIVLYTILHALDVPALANLALELLHFVIETSIRLCPLQLVEHFELIIGKALFVYETFTGNFEARDLYEKNVSKVLKLMFGTLKKKSEEKGYNIMKKINALDPLPEQFNDISPSQAVFETMALKDEIARFLQSKSFNEYPLLRLSGLRSLHRRLISEKNRSEGCLPSSLVTKLLRKLSALVCSLDANDQLKKVAADCASELVSFGIVPSATVVLESDQIAVSHSGKSFTQIEHLIILEVLCEKIIHADLKIAFAALEATERYLSLEAGEAAYEQCSTCVKAYLKPYIGQRLTVPPCRTHKTKFEKSVWLSSKDYGAWMFEIMKDAISEEMEDKSYLTLLYLCELDLKVCERILPLLFCSLLNEFSLNKMEEGTKNLGAMISLVFESFETIERKKLLILLECIEFLFIHCSPFRNGDEPACELWKNIDLLAVAKVANYCHAPFTGLKYIEVWCDVFGKPDLGDFIVNRNDVFDKYQGLLVDIYSSISEPDTFRGIDFVPGLQYQMNCYEKNEQWRDVLGSANSLLGIKEKREFGEKVPVINSLVNAMKKEDFCRLGGAYLKGLKYSEDYGSLFEDYEYELAWRNCDWSLPTAAGTRSPNATEDFSFNKSLYSLICSVTEGSSIDSNQLALDLQVSVLQEMGSQGVESFSSLNLAFSRLLQLKQLMELGASLDSLEEMEKLECIWKKRNSRMKNFTFKEPSSAFQLSLVTAASEYLNSSLPNSTSQSLASSPCGGKVEDQRREFIQQLAVDLLTLRAHEACNASQFDMSRSAIAELEKLRQTECWSGCKINLTIDWLLSCSHLNWKMCDFDMTRSNLEVICNFWNEFKGDRKPLDKVSIGKALVYLGDWKIYFKSESSANAITDFFVKAIELFRDSQSIEEHGKAQYKLAKYYDSQYQSIQDNLKSNAFDESENLRQTSKAELIRLKEINTSKIKGELQRDIKIYRHQLEKQINKEEEELVKLQKESLNFLDGAFKCYFNVLRTGSKYDLCIFRLCSLWFNNSCSDSVNQFVSEKLELVQSHKFICIIYQLAARLGTSDSDATGLFRTTLDKLLHRILKEHPHHSVYVLYALANAELDETLGKSQKTYSKGKRADPKIAAASKILKQLRLSHDPFLSEIEDLCMAYIELALLDVEQYKREKGSIPLPRNLKLNRILSFQNVAVSTSEIPISRHGYSDLVRINSFVNTFQLAGGINLPKIILCKGSDGQLYKQLVKKEDMRQDAVMKQVFDIVNRLLNKEESTKMRDLSVRTYKIIPLTQRTGILEWVKDTVPIGTYLVSGKKSAAHNRYRPQDWTSQQCRKRLVEPLAGETKQGAYAKIVQNFKPVFRFFFFERFPNPSMWFKKRLSYTRSTAASSFAGYIVGLGDRHVQNILIDLKTAELIHIDLGIAFEQGKLLPTPERVPFRLTRDIVDGFGISGVDGVFRSCSEEVMKVLRSNEGTLLTILEVFLHDPLYKWTISPAKVLLKENNNMILDDRGKEIISFKEKVPESMKHNKQAARVMIRLKQKLQGIEESVPLTISGQVNRLIQEARNEQYLSQMFPGWQPYV
eukprot:Nk52_evm68s210 gene=Nk52_evmTU68s210